MKKITPINYFRIVDIKLKYDIISIVISYLYFCFVICVLEYYYIWFLFLI
jgi:hypothetical protein